MVFMDPLPLKVTLMLSGSAADFALRLDQAEVLLFPSSPQNSSYSADGSPCLMPSLRVVRLDETFVQGSTTAVAASRRKPLQQLQVLNLIVPFAHIQCTMPPRAEPQ